MVPEDKIKEFIEKMQAAAGSNLESIILYGSAASGDYHPVFSNVNLFCVLRDGSYAKLRPLSAVVKWWLRQKQPPPLVMTREELQRSAHVFPIEFIDMVQHHRLLCGVDVVEKLEIPMRLHRVQVEYELREKLILLRQHLLRAGNDERRIRELLVRSVISLSTLFRHSLLALGQTSPTTRRDAVVQLSGRVGFDPSLINKVLDVRERKADGKKLRAFEIVSGYLEAIEKVTAAVDKMLEPDASGRAKEC